MFLGKAFLNFHEIVDFLWKIKSKSKFCCLSGNFSSKEKNLNSLVGLRIVVGYLIYSQNKCVHVYFSQPFSLIFSLRQGLTVAQVGLKLSLPNYGTMGMCHHTQFQYNTFLNNIIFKIIFFLASENYKRNEILR